MGIPGLSKQARKYEVAHYPAYMNKSWVYVDGLNIVYAIADTLPKYQKNSAYNEYFQSTVRHIKAITRLRPSKISFYFDGILPVEKIAIRKQRVEKTLRSVHFRDLTFAHDLLMLVIEQRFPYINIVMTGVEAEDEIANDIYAAHNGPATDQRHVIISNDSDFYTFLLPNARNVEIVRVESLRDRDLLRSINLGKIHANNIVAPEHRRNTPVPQLGDSLVNEHRPPRLIMEFLNTAKVLNEFVMYLPTIPSPDISEPYVIGVTIRRAVYTFLFQQKFNGRVDKIIEYQQNGQRLTATVIDPLVDIDLNYVVNELTKTPIEQVIMSQLLEASFKFDLDPTGIEAVGKYVTDLLAGKPRAMANNLHPQATKLDTGLRAVLVCMYFFNGVVRQNHSQMPSYSLIWKITPYELSSYL